MNAWVPSGEDMNFILGYVVGGLMAAAVFWPEKPSGRHRGER